MQEGGRGRLNARVIPEKCSHLSDRLISHRSCSASNAPYHRRALSPAIVRRPTVRRPELGSFFAELHDDARVVLSEAARRELGAQHRAVIGETGGQRRRRPGGRQGQRPCGADGAAAPAADSTDQLAPPRSTSVRALMLIRAYRVRGHLMAHLDPLGLEQRKHAPRARPDDLRLHRSRHGPADLHRQRARAGDGDAPPDRGGPARDLLRHRSASSSCTSRTRTRRPGSRSASRAAATRPTSPSSGKRAILERLTEAEDFERFLRHASIPAPSASAWTAARRPIPAHGADPEARQPARRQGGRARHGASRPAERAGQRHGQALRGDLLRVPGHVGATRTTCRARATSSTTSAPRPTASFDGADDPPVAHRQPVAPGGRRPGRGRQGPGQADQRAAISRPGAATGAWAS